MRGRLEGSVDYRYNFSTIFRSGEVSSTYLDPRNHLSVPKRSERDAMASIYCEVTVARLTRVPKEGNNEVNPVNGAGGGEILD